MRTATVIHLTPEVREQLVRMPAGEASPNGSSNARALSCGRPRANRAKPSPPRWACRGRPCNCDVTALPPRVWPGSEGRAAAGTQPKLPVRPGVPVSKATLETTRPTPRWSVRTMAEAQGISRMAVQRIWQTHDLKPHLLETFKLSTDPRFVEKVVDVVGLYLDPPDRASVLCVDEKSQIQAFDRTRPLLPLRPGFAARQTHDYERHGTTTLFAALNMLDGSVIGRCMPRHRHKEFLKFLDQVDRQTPADLDLHLIIDNYCTHKHASVHRWLHRHRDSICTSSPPAARGSTWSNAGSARSPTNVSAAAPSRACPTWSRRSWRTSKGTTKPGPFRLRAPVERSWPNSPM